MTREVSTFEISGFDEVSQRHVEYGGTGDLCEPLPRKFLLSSVMRITFEVKEGSEVLPRLRAKCRPATEEDLAFVRRVRPEW